jgi:serine/threonine protein kinase
MQTLRRRAAALPAGCIFGRYVITERWGSGHFGDVYAAINERSGQPVAVKVEPETASRPRLPVEARVYKALRLGEESREWPKMRWFGRAHGHYALVMDRLGADLRSKHRESAMQFSSSIVRQVGEQVLQHLEVRPVRPNTDVRLRHFGYNFGKCVLVCLMCADASQLWLVTP